MIHKLALFSSCHQICRGTLANWHIGKEPSEDCSLVDHPVKEFLTADGINILAGVAAGNAEWDFMCIQNINCFADFLERTFTTATVRCFFKAFHTDGGDKIPNALKIGSKFIVNQSCVCEAEENTFRMLFTDFNQVILAYQRFAAGVDVHVSTHCGTLIDDVVNFIKG